jgi:lipoprotein-anchoring transpeptidase ErfK/SrfK
MIPPRGIAGLSEENSAKGNLRAPQKFDAAIRQGGRKVETLKTAIIVVLLLAVLYGVYTVLNKPADIPVGEDIAWQEQQAMEPLQVDLGEGIPTGEPAMDLPMPGMPAADVPATDATSPPASTQATGDFPATAAATEVTPPAEFAVPEDWSSNFSSGEFAEVAPGGDREPAVPATAGSGPDRGTGATEPIGETNGAPASQENFVPWQPPAGTLAAEGAAQAPDADTMPIQSPDVDTTTAQAAEPAGPTSAFDRVLRAAQAKCDEGQLYEALFTLSLQYGDPELTEDQHRKMLNLLDPLAGKVIYSTEHLLEAPYKVQRGETLQQIAEKFSIPWQLLANINGVDNPDIVLPGTELKIVPGPFRAEVDLTRKELTLFVGRLYAGRFPISLGSDPAPIEGEYRVADKQPGREYRAADGRSIASVDPSNPFGGVWIDLGGDLCIHGSPTAGESRLGCISLSPVDANDVYGILSRGSNVVIRR